MSRILVWFRQDLRLHDNPALQFAIDNDKKVFGLYVDTPAQWRTHNLSSRRILFTQEAVKALKSDISQQKIDFFEGSAHDFSEITETILEFCHLHKIEKITFNCEYALNERKRDRELTRAAREQGIEVKKFHGSVIIPPGNITTAQDKPYRVFTPFKRAWLKQVNQYLPNSQLKRAKQSSFRQAPASNTFLQDWKANETEAHQRLQSFLHQQIGGYHESRDIPAMSSTSLLSPYLAIGIISPRACFSAALQANNGELSSGNSGIDAWLNELIWREFYLHLMFAFPEVCKHKPFKPETEAVNWSHSHKKFNLWCEGKTGFPLVDAAMQQLNTTGWMHNRLRMVTATFLTKYLLVDWRWGERYFMEHLVDGHFAANNGGWQWCASTGSDAAPYFRILSPIRQAERFDPDALFIKSMLPQLAHLPAKIIHQPGHSQLLQTGYPQPMVDLKSAKEACIAAFKMSSEMSK